MKKYYFNDGVARFGPFTLEELKEKNIKADTPVWYDGLANWTTAGQLEEFKDILAQTNPGITISAPAATEVKAAEEIMTTPSEIKAPEKTSAPVLTEAATTAPAKSKTPAPVKSGKKSTAWLSYVLGLMVLGGAGYYVYQDMEKNKGNKSIAEQPVVVNDSTSSSVKENGSSTVYPNMADSSASNNENETAEKPTMSDASSEKTIDNTKTTPPPPAAVPPSNGKKPSLLPVTTKPPEATAKAKQAEAQKQAQKKAEEEKRKIEAALLKEKEYRNNWARYITVGKLDYKVTDDGIEGFNVPVYNGTNAIIDKVTVRIDYMKKERKVVKSETITIYNIPAGAGLNGKASGYKKGNNVITVITGVTCRKLHFCFPGSSYAVDDPYYCN